MKLIIAGYGLIGRAIVSSFKSQHDLVIIDPQSSPDNFMDHYDADGCIICINTDKSNVDSTDIFDIIDQLPIFMPILIKSTITPDVVEEINNRYPDHSIVISPDFSRERSTERDFALQTYVILGGEDPDCFWQDLFQSTLPSCNMILNCSDKEAAFVKYATNGFLAVKTSYFNQIYDICAHTGMDFDIVRQLLTTDPRIGTDHSMVPGPDCTRGWAGKSFSNDINKFINWSDSQETPISILKHIIQYNNEIRNNY